MNEIELKPKCVFDCFAKVNAVPRPSKKGGADDFFSCGLRKKAWFRDRL